MQQKRARFHHLVLGTTLTSILALSVGCGGAGTPTASGPDSFSAGQNTGTGTVAPNATSVRRASTIGSQAATSTQTLIVHYKAGSQVSGTDKFSLQGKTIEQKTVPAGMSAQQFRQQLAGQPGVDQVEDDDLYYPVGSDTSAATPPSLPPGTPTSAPVITPGAPSQAPALPIGPGGTVNDAFRPMQWYLDKIGIQQAWSRTMGDPHLVVAVLDTGVDYNHPDLQGQIIKGENYGGDFTDPQHPNLDAIGTDPMDNMGHGTHVAGIIAARANNSSGIAGVAPLVKVLAVKMSSNFAFGAGSATSFAMAHAITFAVEKGAKILNISFGGAKPNKVIKLAIDYALSKGCLIVAAAGNDYTHVGFPAGFPGVMAVAASTQDDKPASFTNHGASALGNGISVAAPGVNILSTTPTSLPLLNQMLSGGDSYYDSWDGTSMASPIVAGAAALVWSAHPDWTAQQVRQRLESTADPVGDPLFFGHGRLNVGKALAG